MRDPQVRFCERRSGAIPAPTRLPSGGQVAVFVAVDHHNAECVGVHAAHHGTRFEALEPIRQGVRQHFGGFAKLAFKDTYNTTWLVGRLGHHRPTGPAFTRGHGRIGYRSVSQYPGPVHR